MESNRTRERDLIIPALKILMEYGADKQLVPTKLLAKELRRVIELSPADRILLKGRNDDRFSQVIRNLVSHRTLEKKGLAVYEIESLSGEQGYKLTDIGVASLLELGIKIEQKTIDRIGQLWLPLGEE